MSLTVDRVIRLDMDLQSMGRLLDYLSCFSGEDKHELHRYFKTEFDRVLEEEIYDDVVVYLEDEEADWFCEFLQNWMLPIEEPPEFREFRHELFEELSVHAKRVFIRHAPKSNVEGEIPDVPVGDIPF